MKDVWPEVIVPADGKTGWWEGAFTINFVYSNKGNFIVKGYRREVEEYLRKRVQNEGLKYVINQVLYGGKNWKTGGSQFRDIWNHYDERVRLSEPSSSSEYIGNTYRTRRVWRENDRKWIFRFNETKHWDSNTIYELKLKRFPNRWVPEFDYKNYG